MPSTHDILPVVAAAGELLLSYGAEVTRVEDTVTRIARAYGIPEVGTFATPTGLIVSLGTEHHLTIVRRVRQRTISLDRVSALNALSREMAVSPLPPDEVLSRIRAIETLPPPFPAWMDPLFSGLSAAAATMLVGGALRDFVPALLANALVQGVQRLSRWLHFPDSIGDFIAGATAVFCALALNTLLGSELIPVIAGGIMILLPGTAFTTSVRDAMAGDLLSAGSRALEATLKAAALAAGVASALYLTGRL
ncbi:MAG: threonine/serine exporter family protein [Mycobacterium leprae]